MPCGESIPRAYGADFREGRLILARTNRGKAEIIAAGAPDAPEVAAALAEAAREVTAGKAALAVACPPDATVMKRLHTPLGSRAKASRVWATLLDLDLPIPIEDAAWALDDERRAPGGGRDATAYALPKADLEAFEARCAESGVDATHEDAFPAALFETPPPATRPDAYRVAVWLGENFAAAAGGTSAGVRVYHVLRAAPSDADAFLQRFAARATQFLELGESPDIWWCGPGAETPGLPKRLEAAVAATGATARFATVPAAGTALALALARRASAGKTVDFKRGAAENPAWAARTRRRTAFWRRLAAGLAVAVLVVCAAAKQRRNATLAGLRADVAATAQRLAGKRLVPGQERLLLGRDPLKSALDARADAFRRLGRAPGTGTERHAAEWLDAVRECGIRATGLSIAPGAVSMSLAPGTPDTALDALAGRLETAGWTVQRGTEGAGPLVKGTRTP